jgi:ligand-binding sensor domain-containing protein/serine phosphatase RsbU (regulator of sigma subunit)
MIDTLRRGRFHMLRTGEAGRSGSREGTISALLAGLAVLVVLCSVRTHAQQLFNFTHLNVKQGLSQSAVMCIFQDRLGFMWFGTQDGLNRYDGYAVRVFKHDPSDSTTIDDNFITSIAEDSSGTLWFGTLRNPDGINRFDRRTGTFTHVPVRSINLRTAHPSSIHSSYLSPDGNEWLGALGKGVYRTVRSTGTVTQFRHNSDDPKSLIDDRVYSVYGDRKGNVWIATHEGLDLFDPSTGGFMHFRHDDKNPNSLSDNWVWPIIEDRDGIMWFGTFRGGLNRFDPATKKFTVFRRSEDDLRGLSDDRIFSLYQDQSGVIWVGTGDNGVDRFHPGLSAFLRYQHETKNPTSLINNGITSAFVDRDGTPWIGTRGGLDRLDKLTGTFAHYKADPANRRGLGDNMVQAMLEDRSGKLWLGFVSAGLDLFDKRTGTSTHFVHDPNNQTSLSDNRVYALADDGSGSMWVGTYGGGLNHFEPATSSFTSYQHSDSSASSLGAPGVWALLRDRAGTLWVGTYGGGLDRFDPTTRTFAHFRHDEAAAASISNDIIVCLFEDHAGRLWIGTTGGLNLMDRQTGTFTSFHEKDGLANEVVFGILEDKAGLLWISTNKGISKFNPSDRTFMNYDENDGLQGNEFNQGAYAADPATGEMYFGGNNGFNRFSPERVLKNTYQPPVALCSFVRYNTEDKEGKPIDEPGIDARSKITLSYKDNVTNIEFAALSFFNNQKNRYAYRLLGYSNNWIQLGTDRRATFTNLDGGEYTLQVKASNNDGIWNDTGTSLQIEVVPPWWKTRWAYGSYGLLGGLILFSLRRVELNRREQKSRIKESELRAKAAEAEKRAMQAEYDRKTKELDDARNLQLSMLPKEIPNNPLYEIAVFMRTATEVGGDYYDFRTSGPTGLDIAFGDATGHGMQAGTIVTLMKGLFLADTGTEEIVPFFQRSSNSIKQIKLGRLLMAFTLVRLTENSVSFSCAGMPPVFVRRKGAGPVEEIMIKGMPLGAMKNFPYVVQSTFLSPGDMMLLMTDGLPEQKNDAGEMYDYRRIEEAFEEARDKSPDEIIQHLITRGDQWRATAPQDDDITLMVIRRRDGQPQ